MDQGKKLSGQSVRAEVYAKAQKIFLAEVPIQVSDVNANAYAWNSKLTGVRPSLIRHLWRRLPATRP